MTVTLTSNYREVLSEEELAVVDKLLGEDYDLEPMLKFIDEHEGYFADYYEDYVSLGEEYGYEAVDAFLTLYSPDDLDPSFERSYLGEFSSPGRMAQDYFAEDWERLDYRIVVDWDETSEYLLQHDVDQVGDHYFRCF